MSERFVSLVLRTASNDEDIWIRCLRETAELYGWSEVFEEQIPGRGRQLRPDGTRPIYPSMARRPIGGKGIRISRSPDKSKLVAGKTNRLRLHSRVTNRDLAELAHFTKGEWYWLETAKNKRVPREEWARIYDIAK